MKKLDESWLGDEAAVNRIAGAYWRARVLLKDREDVGAAIQLLSELRRQVEEKSLGTLDSRDPYESVMQTRVQRLYGQALVRSGNLAGRSEFIELAERLENVELEPTQRGDRLAQLLADLAADLSVIGEHKRAVAITERLVNRSTGTSRYPIELSNLAAWLLQRASECRIAGDHKTALADLDRAEATIEAAFNAREAAEQKNLPFSGLARREAEAIRLSILVERQAHGQDPGSAIGGFRSLLKEATLAAPQEETYLQSAYRIGRLGMAHVQDSSEERETDVARGLAFLHHAWHIAGNHMVRSWLPVALHEAMTLASQDGAADARAFAVEALDRLEPQLGDGHPVVAVLREAAA